MTRSSFEHASCHFKSAYGTGTLHVYSFGTHEEDNVLCLQVPHRFDADEAPLVRVQSACYTAEIFTSTDCDCHEQLHRSLELIHSEGGYLVYMLCDGRGAGLLTKIRGLALGDSDGLDTYDAYSRLGVESDPRDYAYVSEILAHQKVRSLRLLTNNPRKIEGLTSAGMDVVRVPLLIEPTEDSLPYLETKMKKMGHLLRIDDPLR